MMPPNKGLSATQALVCTSFSSLPQGAIIPSGHAMSCQPIQVQGQETCREKETYIHTRWPRLSWRCILPARYSAKKPSPAKDTATRQLSAFIYPRWLAPVAVQLQSIAWENVKARMRGVAYRMNDRWESSSLSALLTLVHMLLC